MRDNKRQIVEQAFTHAGQSGSTAFTLIDRNKVSQVEDIVYHARRVDGSLTAGSRYGIVIKDTIELTDEVVDRLYNVLDTSPEAIRAAAGGARILSGH